MSGDDPYAGADLPSSRNATAVLLALHGVLVLVLLPLEPPTQAVGDAAGWLLALGGVAFDLAAAMWLLRAREVRFGAMLAFAYLGIVQVFSLELLAGSVMPYQALMLVWVGAGAVQPTRRALVLLGVLLAFTVLPLAIGEPPAEARDLIGWALLFAAIGLVLIGYVASVRAQRVVMRAQEEDAQARATTAARRVRDLQWITDAALQYVAVQDLLDELLGRLVHVFGADHGAILLRENDGPRLELRAARGVPPDVSPESYRSVAHRLAGRLALSRGPVGLEQADASGAVRLLLASLDMNSVLGVPLVLDRQLLGVLFVGTRDVRRFSEDDSALLKLVGDRVALAVDRASRFEQERHIAETLQRSLLPERLPQIPGMDVAFRYLPAGAGTEVGGDWFDMFDLGNGCVVLAMGDVVGRGVRAAALMGKLRTSLEAYAFDGHSPAEIVERLHSLMERQHREEMATLLCVAIAPDREHAELASAGHMPMLIRRPNGDAQYVARDASPPLGALPFVRFEEAHAEIEPGSLLLLFTDGLVEVRGTSIELRLEELRRTVEAGSRDADALCDAVLDRMLGGADPRDDVALLVVNVSTLPAEGFSLELPAEPEALSSVRQALERWLTDAGTDRKDAHAIKVACGEACSNAIEHAYRPGDAAFRIEAARVDTDVMITVRDFGGWREPRGTDRGRGLPLMQALMDSVEVDRSAEGTVVQLRRRVAGG
ncbi:MAG TPA: SpoIIE family protein phosphatase [Thermoleophilaceae bacterium]|nr:SpoIIE family protein phosphatase [Thermoleophilaceae bacterium]